MLKDPVCGKRMNRSKAHMGEKVKKKQHRPHRQPQF